MSPAEFKKQMDRLAATYGPKSYPQERADLLWNEFKHLGAETFGKIISRLIGENATAPMVPKFRETAAMIRERDWSGEKREHAADAKRIGDLGNVAERPGSSFPDYVNRVVQRNDRDEMRDLLKFFGAQRIENILQRRKTAAS